MSCLHCLVNCPTYAEKAIAQKPYEIHMETLHPWASSLKAGCEHVNEHCRKRSTRSEPSVQKEVFQKVGPLSRCFLGTG